MKRKVYVKASEMGIGKVSDRFRVLALCLLLALTPTGVISAPPQAKPADPLAQAEALYGKGLWVDAEKAFTQYAASSKNDKTKYESVLKSAICLIRQGDPKKAQNVLSKLVDDNSAMRTSPDTVAKAYLELHGILLKQKNATPSREQLVVKCVKSFPGSVFSAKTCEIEAAYWLKAGRTDKVRLYYGLGGSKISKTAADVMTLISASASAPVTDKDLLLLSAISKTSPELILPLCGILSRRGEGWKAEYYKAMFLADSGKIVEAVAALDEMGRANCGPVDRIQLAKAEMIAFQSSRPKEALKEYRDWLAKNPGSGVREKAEYQYGLLLCNCGLYGESIEQLTAFLKKQPSGGYAPVAEKTIARATEALHASEKRSAELAEKKILHADDPLLPVLERGLKLQNEMKYAAAAKEFQSFRGQEAHPKWGRAWYGLGACLRAAGEPLKAIAVWDEVWSRSRLFTNTLFGVESRRAAGDAWLEDCSDVGNAIVCYDDVLKARPQLASDVKFELNRAICLLALGRSDEAKTIFLKRRSLAKGDKYWEFYWDGMIALCGGPRIQLLKTTAAIDRKTRVRMLLGDSFFMAGECRKAMKQYKSATWNATDPEVLAYCDMQVGRCIAALGDAKEALKAYDKLLSKYPKTNVADDTLLRSGVLCAGPMGNLKEAAKYFARIVKEYPESDNAEAAFIYLATTAWWSKQWDEAERLHKAFLEKYPGSAMNDLIRDRILPAIAGKTLEIKEIEKDNVYANE